MQEIDRKKIRARRNTIGDATGGGIDEVCEGSG